MPHKILYATGLPPEITQVMLSKLFEQYPGFSEVSRFWALLETLDTGGPSIMRLGDQPGMTTLLRDPALYW